MSTVLSLHQLAPTPPHTTHHPTAATWESRWKPSTWKQADGAAGKFSLASGKWSGDAEDTGIQTAEDSKFSVTWAEMDKAVDNLGKDLVLQVGGCGGCGEWGAGGGSACERAHASACMRARSSGP